MGGFPTGKKIWFLVEKININFRDPPQLSKFNMHPSSETIKNDLSTIMYLLRCLTNNAILLYHLNFFSVSILLAITKKQNSTGKNERNLKIYRMVSLEIKLFVNSATHWCQVERQEDRGRGRDDSFASLYPYLLLLGEIIFQNILRDFVIYHWSRLCFLHV